VHIIIIIIRPHRSTTYVDAAYCYRPSSVACWSVCHTSEPCKNGCTDRDAVAITGFVGYNFGRMIASDTLFDSRGGFSGSSYPMKT